MTLTITKDQWETTLKIVHSSQKNCEFRSKGKKTADDMNSENLGKQATEFQSTNFIHLLGRQKVVWKTLQTLII